MTKERGFMPTDDTSKPFVKKVKKKNPSGKSTSNQRLWRSTASSRARARSISPKSGPWVPAPGKATRGGRAPWQGQRQEVNHVRSSDMSTDEEERVGGEVRNYEKKINNLINEVGTLRNEVVLQKALQEIEEKEDLLNTSSSILQQQGEELQHVQDELEQVEAELVVTETENHLLRKNMRLLSEEAEMTKSQKEQLNNEREKLMKKLIEAELDGQAASHQVRELKDLIRLVRDEQRMSSTDQVRLLKQKDLLLKTLADFEATNRALQHLLRDHHRLEAAGLRLGDQRDILLRKLADYDLINEKMRHQLLDCEALIADLRTQLQVEKEERLALTNLQGSLESTRGHLQKQLRTREADCNRMSVQIRNLEGQLSQERIEKDHLQDTVSSFRNKTEREREALKKALRRVKELEAVVERMEDSSRTQHQSLTARLQEKVAENSNLRTECDRLKNSVSFIEGKLGQMEEDGLQQKEVIKHYEKLVDEYRQQENESATLTRLQELQVRQGAARYKCNAGSQRRHINQHRTANRVRSEADESNVRLEELARERERVQRMEEQELEKVKHRLQQRLLDLEPLPELLRATELRLQEANEKILSHEKRNMENTKTITELTAKLECNSETVEHLRMKCSDSQDSSRSFQSRHETLERRLQEMEEKNQELVSAHTKLQESLQQESMRLDEKSRENVSLSRQLENALADLRKQQDSVRERYLSKERTYQARIVDLETQLSQLRADQTRLKREKEETERKFNSRLYDLKDRLEQCQSSNRSMQNYVQFLKNSYSNVFGESTSSLPPSFSPIKPYP